MYKCVRAMTHTWQAEDNTGVSFLSIFTWAPGWDSSPQDARHPAGPLKELVILGHRSIGRMNAINPRPAWPIQTVYKPIKVYTATFCQPLPLTDNYNNNNNKKYKHLKDDNTISTQHLVGLMSLKAPVLSQVWCCIPIIHALRRLGQEDLSKSVDFIVRSCSQKKTNTMPHCPNTAAKIHWNSDNQIQRVHV